MVRMNKIQQSFFTYVFTNKTLHTIKLRIRKIIGLERIMKTCCKNSDSCNSRKYVFQIDLYDDALYER